MIANKIEVMEVTANDRSTALLKQNENVENKNRTRTDRRRNVMVFLPCLHSLNNDKEVENVLTYLGCDKASIQDTEIVRDRSEYYDEKIVLRVQMDSVEQASKAFANGYKLKYYDGPKIFIAKDMTYSQRIKLRELVMMLRENIRLEPKYRWKIVDWEVVKVGLFKKRDQTNSDSDSIGNDTDSDRDSDCVLEPLKPLEPLEGEWTPMIKINKWTNLGNIIPEVNVKE